MVRRNHSEINGGATVISRETSTAGAERPIPVAPIHRLLFIADTAAADVDALPPPVRTLIDEAAEVCIVPPALPGRLAWLADDVDRFRDLADERLDIVVGHMRSIGANVRGAPRRGSLLTVIADAVAEFHPDHILIALRSPEHANWQERRVIEHIEASFGIPLTTYTVDPHGHTSTATGPLLLCFDGSESAKLAIERAGALFRGRDALVATVGQATPLGSLAWAGVTASMADFFRLDRAAAEVSGRVAEEGARIATEAGLHASPIAVEAAGPVWTMIVETADRHDAAMIVMGSRGLTGLRSTLLGSVSSAVVHHTDRPTLLIRQPVTE